MPNKKNVDAVKALEDKIKQSQNLVVTGYQGLSTVELGELRDKLTATSCKYEIVKNALKNVGLEEFAKYFTGPTAIAFHKGDPSTLSKTIVEFSKKNEKLKIIAGWLDGKLLTDKEIKNLASLPSREALLTKIAVMLKMPIHQIATVLNAPLQKLAQLLQAVSDQKAKA